MQKHTQPVKAGVGTVEAAQMVDSSPLLLEGHIDAAKERLARDGYLLLRGYLPADKCCKVDLRLPHHSVLHDVHSSHGLTPCIA